MCDDYPNEVSKTLLLCHTPQLDELGMLHFQRNLELWILYHAEESPRRLIWSLYIFPHWFDTVTRKEAGDDDVRRVNGLCDTVLA